MNRFESNTKPLMWFMAMLLAALVAGCGGDDGTQAVSDTTAPTVSSTVPINAASGVVVTANITATFSELMDASTITGATFTLMQGASAVSGVVASPSTTTATFNPNNDLAGGILYTATITTGVKDLAGNALASDEVWTFTTAAANPTAPTFGEAGRYVILASQAVSGDAACAISNGDIGNMDQARATYITGFTPSGGGGDFVELTNGSSYAMDDLCPAPFTCPLHYSTPVVGATWTDAGTMITQVRTDLGIAATFLAADPNPGVGVVTQVCPIELGLQVLTRGVYKTASNVGITTGPLHLDAQGDPNAVFIFNIGGTLTTGAGGDIILDNLAQAKNVYWRTAGITTIAAGTNFKGIVVAGTQVNVLAGANVTGSLYGVTGQVTLISNTVTKAP